MKNQDVPETLIQRAGALGLFIETREGRGGKRFCLKSQDHPSCQSRHAGAESLERYLGILEEVREENRRKKEDNMEKKETEKRIAHLTERAAEYGIRITKAENPADGYLVEAAPDTHFYQGNLNTLELDVERLIEKLPHKRKKAKGPGRPPQQELAPVAEIKTTGLPAMKEAADAQAMADTILIDSAKTLEAVGAIKALRFVATVADTQIATMYRTIKETKSYKGLPYTDQDGNLRHVATLEEFCTAILGKSYRRCQELYETLTLLGGELYEAAEQIGFQARDYRALKALPAEDQDAMRQALANNDQDEAMTLLAELVARHKDATEKERGISEALRREIQGRRADYEALEENYKEQSAELVRFKSGREPPPPPGDRVGRFIASIDLSASQALSHVTHMDNMRKAMMSESLNVRAVGSEEENALFERARERFAGHLDHAIHEIRVALDGAQAQLERTFGWSGEAHQETGQ